MSDNYYDVLGIQKNASKDEIKKAFHKLAHKYHPDKGGDAEKFKKVNEAYQILSDDKKRAEYDSYGRVFSQGGGQQGAQGGFGFDPNDFAGFDFGNMGDIFGDIFGGGRSSHGPKRGRDISTEIHLPFADAVFGVEREIILTKNSMCDVCHGSGGKPGSKQVTCKTCNGKGKIHETKNSIFGSFTSVATCSICAGVGKIPEESCTHCKGYGVLHKQETIKVRIPAGIENGEIVRISEAGEAIKGGESGDLYIKINVSKHPIFSREGANLRMSLTVKLSDALLGANYTVETLDGTITVSIPAGISPGEILRVKGKGVPMGGSKRGDLFITANVTLPAKLSRKAKTLIEELKEGGI